MRMKVTTVQRVSLVMAILAIFYSNAFVSFANAEITKPTPFSTDELAALDQAEVESREVVPVQAAGADNGNDPLVITFAVLGLIVLIGAIIASSNNDSESK